MARNDISYGDALSFGWKTMKETFWFFAGYLLAMGIINIVVQISIENDNFDYIKGNLIASVAIGIIVLLIASFVQALVEMGFIKNALEIHDGRDGMIDYLYSCYPLFLKYFAGTMLYYLISGIGLILLVVPGIIISIRFRYYEFLIVDEHLGPIDALKKSYEITRGQTFNLFSFALLQWLINVAGIMALLIGLFATLPMTKLADAYIYRRLLNQADFVVQTEPIADTTP